MLLGRLVPLFFLKTSIRFLLSLIFIDFQCPLLRAVVLARSVKDFSSSSGVYISQYSDRLDQNPWSHGKSGYIAVIKLTKVMGGKGGGDCFKLKRIFGKWMSLPTGSSERGFREVHPECDGAHQGLQLSHFKRVLHRHFEHQLFPGLPENPGKVLLPVHLLSPVRWCHLVALSRCFLRSATCMSSSGMEAMRRSSVPVRPVFLPLWPFPMSIPTQRLSHCNRGGKILKWVLVS